MSKLFQLVSKYLLIPLIMDGVKFVLDWWNTRKENKALKKRFDTIKGNDDAKKRASDIDDLINRM